MLSSPISVTYDGTAYSLHRTEFDNNRGSFYYVKPDGTLKLVLSIAHTIPKKVNGAGEQHLVRLDVSTFDAVTGILLRTVPVWTVLRTDGNVQDSATSKKAAEALFSFLTATSSANLVAALDRRS